MKRKNRALIVLVTLVLTFSSVTGVVFADIDYNQWNSQAAYPQDIVQTPLFSAVKALIDKKILSGYPDGTFKPNNYITRAEIAVAVAKMTNQVNDLDNMAEKNIFSDLSGYDWAKGYINASTKAGYIKGVTSTNFAPGKNISYAELVTMLIRTKGGASSELEMYGKWPDNYIQYAQMYNIIGDVVVTDWNAPATRGDTAKIMYRVMPN